MKHKLNIAIIILSIILLIISGCSKNVPVVKGELTAEIPKNIIKSGEMTKLEVKGKNIGNAGATFHFSITPENTSKVIVTYPGNLEATLQPGEDTGKKIIDIQGCAVFLCKLLGFFN